MATAADHYVGIAKETTFGTAVTPTRFYPFVEGTESEWDIRWQVGQGVVGGAGRRTQLSSRRFLRQGQGKVTLAVELESRGIGALLDIALGVSSVGAVTGGSIQTFHLGVANLVLPSATIQIVKVRNDGTQLVETYRGCTAAKVEIEQGEDEIPILTVEFDALNLSTVTAAATAAFPAVTTLFDASQCQVSTGGTFVAPTATTLASLTGGVTSAAFRKFKLTIDQKLDTDGWVLASTARSQPKVGVPEIKLSATVELLDNALTGAFLAGTQQAYLVNWTTTESVGPSFAALQVAIPRAAIEKGLPNVSPGEPGTTFDLDLMVTNDGTNRDILISQRTADTAL